MTLAIGDMVVKLDRNTGKPVGDHEAYVEFEVVDLSPTYSEAPDGDWKNARTVQFAKLRKVR